MNPHTPRLRPVPAFLRWYLLDKPWSLILWGIRYAAAIFESFSIIFLLKTLFSPWKNILDEGRTRSIEARLEAWSLNLLSRGVGCVVRLAAVVAGSILTLVALVIGVVCALVWYILPIFFVTLPYIAVLFRKDVIDNDTGAGLPIDVLSPTCIPRGSHRETLTARELLSAVLASPHAGFVIGELMIDRTTLASAFDAEAEVLSLPELLSHADDVRREFRDVRIEPIHVMVALLGTQTGLRLLQTADADVNDLWQVALRQRMYARWSNRPGPWSPEGIKEGDMFGQSWARGYTDALDLLTTDIRAERWDPTDVTILHRSAVEASVHALRESGRDNVLIAAPPGSGRTMLVRHIVAAVHDIERSRHERFTRFMRLRADILLSGTANPDAFLLQALARAKRERLAFVIPELALLLKATDPKLRLVLQRCLEAPNISIIGIVDPHDLHTLVEKDGLMSQAFQKILLNASDDKEVMQVLAIESFRWEDSGVIVSYKALKAVISLCRRFMPQAGYPAVCIDVLDDSAREAMRHGSRVVLEEDVRTVVTLKSRVDVSKFSAKAAPKLLELEETMQRRVIGQRAGIRVLCDALKRASADVRTRPRPLGTFLFLGPTGVGKTRTAQVLAEEYFGSADALIRLDLNGCSTEESVQDVIGDGTGSSALTRRVQERPFSVVLLDEIEKAHPKVLNLFLQVLDEGQLRSTDGSITDFRNTIIIATSNAGALFVRDRIANPSTNSGQGADEQAFSRELVDHILHEKTFTPEFVNRFDATVVFRPLTGDEAISIASLMVEEVVAAVKESKGVEITIEPDAVKALLERGYSPEFGARELRRIVSDVIENHLADRFLREQPKRGDHIVIHREDLRL